MTNSYGVECPPEWALFGVYDVVNGEWTGEFFSDWESASEAAASLADDEQFGVVSTQDDETWL